MSILCLTGWQQPADALVAIAPGAMHFDYSGYGDVQRLFAELPPTPKLAIGWSLGGQILVRAIAAGKLRPKALLLLGAPFQWIGDARMAGMPREALPEIERNYKNNPVAMLKNLNALVALGDEKEKPIIKTLNARVEVWKQGAYWLGELARTSCRDLNFSAFPKTQIVHGVNDKVIYPNNAESFARAIPEAELLLLQGCAHAPQLHDTERLKAMVQAHV